MSRKNVSISSLLLLSHTCGEIQIMFQLIANFRMPVSNSIQYGETFPMAFIIFIVHISRVGIDKI
jgi:hypothetical protein